MALSKLVNENEEYIKDAIQEGIDPNAVNSTLEDVVNKSDELGKTPKQVKDAVEAIVDMKSSQKYTSDEKYASDFVKENSGKIKSALNDGITPEEVTSCLFKSTNEANTKSGRKRLSFITKLISKMKIKEKNLKKEREAQKGRQKVLGK